MVLETYIPSVNQKKIHLERKREELISSLPLTFVLENYFMPENVGLRAKYQKVAFAMPMNITKPKKGNRNHKDYIPLQVSTTKFSCLFPCIETNGNFELKR